MIKRVKLWIYLAALFGGTMFQLGGCALNKQTARILAILQEDIFG